MLAVDAEEANKMIMGLVPVDGVLGIGDSTTVAQLGAKAALRERGTRVLDAYDRENPNQDAQMRDRIKKEASTCEYYLTGTNALTRDGRLVNVDGNGNRVAGMFWGHHRSIIVVGRNKIVDDLDEAFHRIRKITAPNHVRLRSEELGGIQFKTPCAATGECSDCRSEDRACNVFTIIEGKPLQTEINVIIVDEDLGLGWDESWPEERIKNIIENYKRFVWIPHTRTRRDPIPP